MGLNGFILLGWTGCIIQQATSKRLSGFFSCFNILIFIHFLKYKTIGTHASTFLPLNISAVCRQCDQHQENKLIMYKAENGLIFYAHICQRDLTFYNTRSLHCLICTFYQVCIQMKLHNRNFVNYFFKEVNQISVKFLNGFQQEKFD